MYHFSEICCKISSYKLGKSIKDIPAMLGQIELFLLFLELLSFFAEHHKRSLLIDTLYHLIDSMLLYSFLVIFIILFDFLFQLLECLFNLSKNEVQPVFTIFNTFLASFFKCKLLMFTVLYTSTDFYELQKSGLIDLLNNWHEPLNENWS